MVSCETKKNARPSSALYKQNETSCIHILLLLRNFLGNKIIIKYYSRNMYEKNLNSVIVNLCL